MAKKPTEFTAPSKAEAMAHAGPPLDRHTQEIIDELEQLIVDIKTSTVGVVYFAPVSELNTEGQLQRTITTRVIFIPKRPS